MDNRKNFKTNSTDHYTIDGFDTPRLADTLIIYTDKNRSTGTNSYGCEAVCLNGTVISASSNNNSIPKGGFVVSGHGKMAEAVKASFIPGALVTVSGNDIQVTVTPQTHINNARYLLDKLKAFAEKCQVPDDRDISLDIVRLAHSCLSSCSPNMNSQALVLKLEQIYSFMQNALLIASGSKSPEARGIWMRSENEKCDADVEKAVKRIADAGFNLLLVETFYNGYVIYPDSAFAKQRPDLDFDLLGSFVKYGEKYGVEIHAWVEDFFVGNLRESSTGTSGSPIIDEHPDWALKLRDGSIHMTSEPEFVYMNPLIPEVTDLLSGLYREMVVKYRLSGIQLDYIRYPLATSVDNMTSFDDITTSQFKRKTTLDVLSITDFDSKECELFASFKAGYITSFVKRIAKEMKETSAELGRKIYLSTAVFGDPVLASKTKSQDWQLWIKRGYLDFISPMAYYNDFSEVNKEVEAMTKAYPMLPNYAGIAPMYHGLPVLDSTKQIIACRHAKARGVFFFAAGQLTDEQIVFLKKGPFRYQVKPR